MFKNWLFGRGQGQSRTRRQRSVPVVSWVEALENRTLLATLVSPVKLTYQDGDDVAVTFSKPILNAANVNSVFQFNSGSVNGSNNSPQQLRQINLVGVAGAAGTTITTVSIRSAVRGGDGFAALGSIDATDLDLGAVTIDGDLGRILAGDANSVTQGVGALKAQSMGRFGTVTGAADLHSVILGRLSSLTLKTDLKGAFVEVIGDANGTIGSVTIGGSIIGMSAFNSGRVSSSGNMGAVIVSGDVRGGAGTQSGLIGSYHDIASVTIGGSVIGGSSAFAGCILTDFLGGGPDVGGAGGHIGAVKITGDLLGGSDTGAGSIISESGKLASVTIGGSVLAGSGDRSAHIHSDMDMGAVSITGNVVGGGGIMSGEIESIGKMASVTIGGPLKGGAGDGSGSILSNFDLGAAKIAGDIVGGGGTSSEQLTTLGKLASATIGGSVRGDTGNTSGAVFRSWPANVEHVSNMRVVLSFEHNEIVLHESFTDRLHRHDIGFSTSGCSTSGCPRRVGRV